MTNASKGWSNPALKAMGIPHIKLPSRNWLIFWTLATTTLSGIVYDKYQQKQIIKHHTAIVKDKLNEPMHVNEMSRKITVFIAPPPSDYLDTSMKIWRRYIKPILFYSGLDYDVVSEEKQGVIRTYVANEIRRLRRDLINEGNNSLAKIEEINDSEIDKYQKDESNTGLKFKQNFDYRKLVGIFYKNDNINDNIEYDDAKVIDSKLSGGIICLGRGAYKEYINGLHEGLLGPLDPPTSSTENTENILEKTQDNNITESEKKTDDIVIADTIDDDPFTKNELEEIETKEVVNELPTKETEGNEKDVKEKDANDENLQTPFIALDKFKEANLPSEIISQLPTIRDPNTKIPILLHQPVLMITVPNLIGFVNIPTRIKRFYQKRYYCESVCKQVSNLVNQTNIRRFNDPTDLNLGSIEELDWPNYWIQQGKRKNSEWVRELHSNKEVTDWLWVYDIE